MQKSFFERYQVLIGLICAGLMICTTLIVISLYRRSHEIEKEPQTTAIHQPETEQDFEREYTQKLQSLLNAVFGRDNASATVKVALEHSSSPPRVQRIEASVSVRNLKPDQCSSVKELVKNALGIDESRGDSVTVVNSPASPVPFPTALKGTPSPLAEKRDFSGTWTGPADANGDKVKVEIPGRSYPCDGAVTTTFKSGAEFKSEVVWSLQGDGNLLGTQKTGEPLKIAIVALGEGKLSGTVNSLKPELDSSGKPTKMNPVQITFSDYESGTNQ